MKLALFSVEYFLAMFKTSLIDTAVGISSIYLISHNAITIKAKSSWVDFNFLALTPIYAIVLVLSFVLENSEVGSGINGILYAAPIADFISIFVILILTITFFRSLSKLPTEIEEEKETIKESKLGLIITISREHGSKGKQIGKMVADKLGIPFYYKEMIAIAAQESGLDKEFISNINTDAPNILYDLYVIIIDLNLFLDFEFVVSLYKIKGSLIPYAVIFSFLSILRVATKSSWTLSASKGYFINNSLSKIESDGVTTFCFKSFLNPTCFGTSKILSSNIPSSLINPHAP